MKTLRTLFTITALVVAAAFTFGFELRTRSTAINGYQYVSGGNPQCVEHVNACDDAGGNPCMISTGGGDVRLRLSPSGTCGDNAFKQ